MVLTQLPNSSRAHSHPFHAPPGFTPTCPMTTLIMPAKTSGGEQRRPGGNLEEVIIHRSLRTTKAAHPQKEITGKAESGTHTVRQPPTAALYTSYCTLTLADISQSRSITLSWLIHCNV